MIVTDYNGVGIWSVDDVLQRYSIYARRYNVASPLNLSPREHHENGRRWIYPIMYGIIECIEAGDPACVEIGVEFIEESRSFPFGRMLKSNTARALRRATLGDEQKARIRKRVVEMLCTGYLPREYHQYAKLARQIGLAECLWRVEREADFSNLWVRKYYDYFKESAVGEGRA